jgi:phage head maturation protease
VWLELREDARGLYARGRLIPEVARARELLSLLRAGAVDGLSIGFRTVKGRIDPKTRVRSLLAVDLWEISIVTFPLLAGARVRTVKQAPSRSRDGSAMAAQGASSPRHASSPRTRAEKVWRGAPGTPRAAARHGRTV